METFIGIMWAYWDGKFGVKINKNLNLLGNNNCGIKWKPNPCFGFQIFNQV